MKEVYTMNNDKPFAGSENEQRINEILSNNPDFASRYQRIKDLRNEIIPDNSTAGLSDDEINNIVKTVKKKHGFYLPDNYLTFLKLTDGFGYFDPDDCHRRLRDGNYLCTDMVKLGHGYVIGDYDDWGIPCYYQYSEAKKRFFSFDHGGGSLLYVFDTFFDMLDHFLGLEIREGGVYDDENYNLIREDIKPDFGQDQEKPVSWYIKEAEKGCPAAQCELAKLYEQGEGIDVDVDKAVFWYLQSAKQGHVEAQFYLGCLYFSGDTDDPDDYAKALYWMEEAAEQGCKDALDWLSELHAGDSGADAWD